jgi:hypothetical protein
MRSSSQSKDVHDNYSTLTTSNPPEGKTIAVIVVMRGNPKDGYTHQCSNKHCKQRLVRVLLDSGSEDDLVFVSKQTHAAYLLKKADSTVVEYFEWDLPDKA